VRVLVAQGVGQGEGVEDVVLAAGHPVALAGAGGDPGIDREDAVPAGLQPLNEQPLRAFHADRQAGSQLGEFRVELVEACNVVAQPDLPLSLSGRADRAELMVAGAPVDTDEDLVDDAGLDRVAVPHAPGPSSPVTSWPARLDAHLGARGTTPTGQ
jgi:hypothetical protein